jgi:hypothetical protein
MRQMTLMGKLGQSTTIPDLATGVWLGGGRRSAGAESQKGKKAKRESGWWWTSLRVSWSPLRAPTRLIGGVPDLTGRGLLAPSVPSAAFLPCSVAFAADRERSLSWRMTSVRRPGLLGQQRIKTPRLDRWRRKGSGSPISPVAPFAVAMCVDDRLPHAMPMSAAMPAGRIPQFRFFATAT